MPETVRVYFDYLCPYAWRAAEVASAVEPVCGVAFDWQHFSLFQAHRQGDGWQLWNERIDPADESGTRGLLPFLASCAARRQGPGRHAAFRLGLLRARHRDLCDLTLPTILRVAEAAGLHMPCFESDLADPEARTRLAQEHHRAVGLGQLVSPTFQFADGRMADLRLRDLPRDRDEAVRLFDAFRRLLEDFPYLEEVRRPSPKGN